MKIIMGIIQAIFGVVFIGFVGLITVISIGIVVVQDAFDWFKKINNETSEAIKDYYRGLEKRDNE